MEENILQHLIPSKYNSSYIALSDERVIFLNEDFTQETASALTALLLYYDAVEPDEPIIIYINSYGGEVSALANIYDVIQMISAPVQTICMGRAYSAGAFLLAAGTEGCRFVFPNSQIMIHGLQATFPVSGHSEPHKAKEYLEHLNSINNNLMKILAKHTGQPIDKIKQDCKYDMYFTAEEAVEYGLADYILDSLTA